MLLRTLDQLVCPYDTVGYCTREQAEVARTVSVNCCDTIVSQSTILALARESGIFSQKKKKQPWLRTTYFQKKSNVTNKTDDKQTISWSQLASMQAYLVFFPLLTSSNNAFLIKARLYLVPKSLLCHAIWKLFFFLILLETNTHNTRKFGEPIRLQPSRD